jgi:hypothetical protein
MQHYIIPDNSYTLDVNKPAATHGLCCIPTSSIKRGLLVMHAAAADFFRPRTTCWLSCKQPAVVSSLSSPPYKIHNGGFGFGRQAPLQSNVIHPTASECLQLERQVALYNAAHVRASTSLLL